MFKHPGGDFESGKAWSWRHKFGTFSVEMIESPELRGDHTWVGIGGGGPRTEAIQCCRDGEMRWTHKRKTRRLWALEVKHNKHLKEEPWPSLLNAAVIQIKRSKIIHWIWQRGSLWWPDITWDPSLLVAARWHSKLVHDAQKEIHTTSKHVERRSPSLIVNEMQAKTILRYLFFLSCQISPKTNNNKKFNNSLCYLGSRVNRHSSTLLIRMQIGSNSGRVYQKSEAILGISSRKGFSTGT